MINDTPNHPLSYNHDSEAWREANPEFVEQSYTAQPTKLEMAISLFQKLGTSEGVGSVHPVSVRIPTIEFASVQAMAKHSGLSLNKVFVELLQVALDEVWQGLDDDNRMALTQIRSEVLGKLLEPGESQSSKKGEI